MTRAIAVDIDGTLSDQNRVLCPAAVEAIRRLKVPVVLTAGKLIVLRERFQSSSEHREYS